jgi:hypothetical protein
MVLGLAVILVSFTAEVSGEMNQSLMWTFVIGGAIIAILALWGLIDELRYSARLTEEDYR